MMSTFALSTFLLGEAQEAPITTGLAPRLTDLQESDRRRLQTGETEYALGAAGTPECDSGSWNNVYCGAAELEKACDAFPGFHRITRGASKAECEAAQTWLMASGATVGARDSVTDMYDGLLPHGCIFGHQSWDFAAGDGVHWNTQLHGGQGREQWGGSSARSDPNWRPICAKTAAPPSDDGFVYTAGHIGVYGCPSSLSGNCPELLNACPTGYTRMDKDSTDKEDCNAALDWMRANDDTIYLWNVNAPSYMSAVDASQSAAFDMALGGVHGLPGGCICAGGVTFNSETSGVSHGSYRPMCRKAVATPQTCEQKLETLTTGLAELLAQVE